MSILRGGGGSLEGCSYLDALLLSLGSAWLLTALAAVRRVSFPWLVPVECPCCGGGVGGGAA